MQIRIKWWHVVCAAAGWAGWIVLIVAFAYHDALLSAQEKSKPAPPLPAPEYLKLETAPTFIMDTGSKAPVIELRKCDSQGKCELLVVRESWNAKAKILLTVHMDGSVVPAPGVQVDDITRQFWKSLADAYPAICRDYKAPQ